MRCVLPGISEALLTLFVCVHVGSWNIYSYVPDVYAAHFFVLLLTVTRSGLRYVGAVQLHSQSVPALAGSRGLRSSMPFPSIRTWAYLAGVMPNEALDKHVFCLEW
jgi:hypothetical protein